MPSIRPCLAAIQQRFPATYARIVTDDPAGVTVDDLNGLKTLPAGPVPERITVEGLRIHCSADPTRLSQGAGTCGKGPLAGQAAVVSGAASGLGMALARGFLEAGAAVTGTDVDAAGLARLAAEWNEPARFHTATVDVTQETSVAAGFDQHLARFGRLDLVACAAGIAPPFELVDFPLDKWRLALEINLTGYFLCAREAARIMIAQGHGGSMVMLSSKSGLEPSKANSAYNATKAGELHLARGWALELGRHGIRVNCIAPGNVFEGSKIWNPEYIRKAAEKKGIKPEEVIPYYNSLTALNAEIKPTDIANAAVFLCSEQARRMTGQVLVVDAGQVWTR